MDSLIVMGVIVAAYLPYLLGIVTPGVTGFTSGLATIPLGPYLGHAVGLPWIDPNVGYVSQSFGHLSALDIVHGHLPWWNPFEGVGSPLAGEGQSAALFPLTILLFWRHGQLYFHLILQLIAGFATLRLLSEMGMKRWVCIVGGILFGLNGTFAWLTNAPFNPVAFLPVVLWGIERSRNRPWRQGISGWLIIALGISMSIYSGFPETAYLDGLLALGWAVVRFVQQPKSSRFAFGATVGIGGVIGLLVSTPFFMAFASGVKGADIGGHAGGFATSSLPTTSLNTLGMPYLFGPIMGYSGNDPTGQLNASWGTVGGYLTIAVILMAVFGLIMGRHRGLGIYLFGWFTVTISAAFGVPFVHHWINFIPGINEIALGRYIPPSWEMLTVILACIGLDRIGSDSGTAVDTGPNTAMGSDAGLGLLTNSSQSRLDTSAKTGLAIASIIATLIIGLMVLPLQNLMNYLERVNGYTFYEHGALIWAIATVVLITLVGLICNRRVAATGIGLILVIEAVAMFMTPQLSAPTSIPINTGVVTYLQHHLGLSRFATLGPVVPNYGSFFQIAEVNDHDLPMPGIWANYIGTHLETNELPQQFDGATSRNPNGPQPIQEVKLHLASYEAIGVRYLITPASWGHTVVPGKRVYSNHLNAIWELSTTAPYYYVTAGSCVLTNETIDSLTSDCSRPSTLVRSELDLPGWTASVNGVPGHLSKSGSLFMSLNLPAGSSEINFSYLPPHMRSAGGLALDGVALGIFFTLMPTLRKRKPVRAVKRRALHAK